MKAIIETELGNLEIFLDTKNAPLTANYFAEQIRKGELDRTSFFRIVGVDSISSQTSCPIEVLQAGNWVDEPEQVGKIEHESTQDTGLCHQKWSLSTARYGLGEVYGSFFICMRSEPSLDCGGRRHPDGKGFSVFGKILSGFSILEKIYADREAQEFQKKPIKIRRIFISN